MKKLIAGNWKMNGNIAAARSLAREMSQKLEADAELLNKCEFLVCPPFLHIAEIRGDLAHMSLGAQDCSQFEEGAYTGDIAASMLKDAGCAHVILGHSERRQHFGETSGIVAVKAMQAHKQGLVTIICLGETEAERERGDEKEIVAKQIKASLPACATAQNTVIAYEPVWAIGTGKTALPEDVRVMHGFIRERLKENIAESQKMRILYGGSMKPDNAKALLHTPDVDGGLIGGASLKADQFLAIAKAV